MDYTTDNFLKTLYYGSEKLRSATDRMKLGELLKEALGAFPPQDTPLQPVLLERRDHGSYVLERIAYTTMEHVQVPVIVLVPKDGTQGPWPGILACHGHGNGQYDAVGRNADDSEMNDPGIHNRFAVNLVHRGLVVAIPEIMGFGVRRMAEELRTAPNYSSCGTLASQLLAYGKTLAGMRVYEAMRALDYLQFRDDVIGERIGAFGFSGGGLIAAYTAALDKRIKHTVLSGWANTFEGSILAMHHCIDNYLPKLLLAAEQPDFIGLLSPRGLFVEAGEEDPIFPLEHTRKAISTLENHYAVMGAEENFEFDVFPGGHRISGRKSFDWLAQRLAN
ncbi:alpha/beta hydrolase family protein [Paenibacillaceae bacterium WGS1546]|uniref:alpha/beta hydrolase family protein n=1 Tax=Cohnella sp. WGS1546 TaxID=3366810 RepID=UPI00372D0647